MILDFPELFAPKISVSGLMGKRWVAPNALKLPMDNSVITHAVSGEGGDSARRLFVEPVTV